MSIRTFIQPVGIFGVAAVISTLFAMANLMGSWPEGNYSFWLYTASGLLFLESVRQILADKVSVKETRSIDESGTDAPFIPLNLLSFVLPPLGLVSWLAFDNKSPRKARSAGRSAVRGVIVALIAFWVWNSYTQVSIAIQAIEYAQLTPVNVEKVEKSLQYRKMLRLKQQKA